MVKRLKIVNVEKYLVIFSRWSPTQIIARECLIHQNAVHSVAAKSADHSAVFFSRSHKSPS